MRSSKVKTKASEKCKKRASLPQNRMVIRSITLIVIRLATHKQGVGSFILNLLLMEGKKDLQEEDAMATKDQEVDNNSMVDEKITFATV